MENFSTRDLIVETVNKLFVYTDLQEWNKLQAEVFTENVFFDMSSLGGEKKNTTARDICETWKKGFAGIDSVNHLAGNYIIEMAGQTANAFAYATATHYRKAAVNGTTRDFIGSYEIHLAKTEKGWRINQFRYNLKFTTGNIDLT
ncbi:MAG TPA: nuclear transport factor 2 family protein [Chitinophagaceae bacterium]